MCVRMNFSSVWVAEWSPLGKELLTVDYVFSVYFECCDLSYFLFLCLGLTLKILTFFILLQAKAVGIR